MSEGASTSLSRRFAEKLGLDTSLDAAGRLEMLRLEPFDAMLRPATDIVCAYVSNNAIPYTSLPGLIRLVRATLAENVAVIEAASPAASEAPQAIPAIAISKSITPDHLVSLIDGKPYKSLKRHLSANGLTPVAYRQKFGLPADYPMVAANYSARRSALATAAGLGRPKAPATAPAVDQAA